MAKKRKANRKRTMRPNPAAPALRAGVMVPVLAVKVNREGIVQSVVVEDKHMGKALKKRK
jgi:hypothetical protein